MKEYIEREIAAEYLDFIAEDYKKNNLKNHQYAVEYCADYIRHRVLAADVVPWEWLKSYAHGKGMQNTSMFIFEAMDEWGKENQG